MLRNLARCWSFVKIETAQENFGLEWLQVRLGRVLFVC